MKSLFVCAIACVSIRCYASEQPLTLSEPLSLTLSHKVLYWGEEFDVLTSWKLSFTMTTTGSMSGGDIFRTRNIDTAYRKKFLSLSVKDKVKIYSTTDASYYESSDNLFKSSQEYTLTLLYVTTLDTLNSPISGKFEMFCNDVSVGQFVIYEPNKVNIAWLNNSKEQGAILDTVNGSYKYRDIVLTKLDDRIIPEPSTTFLIFTSVCGFMMYRRRR